MGAIDYDVYDHSPVCGNNHTSGGYDFLSRIQLKLRP